MELKRALVVNNIQLGMEIDKAFRLAGLSETDITLLEKDSSFLEQVEITKLILEKELLEKHAQAIDIAVSKGNTKPVEWMLAKLNPEKWGEKELEVRIPGRLVITKDDEQLL